MKYAVFVVVLVSVYLVGGVAFANQSRENEKNSSVPSADGALAHATYANGFIQWSDASQLPRNTYTVRGQLQIAIYPSFIRVAQGDHVWFIPWSNVHYIGKEIQPW